MRKKSGRSMRKKSLDDGERLHVGLNNSSMRLKYFYGETAKIRVESRGRKRDMLARVSFPYDLEESE